MKNIFLGLSILMIMGAGCSTTHKTTTTETTVQYPNREDPSVKQRSTEVGSNQAVVVEHSSTSTTETKPQDRGVIGGLLHVVGTIIAFPFVVIGGFLQWIF